MSLLQANSRVRIIVLGYIIRGPLGGMAWSHLQYPLGLADLGHDVYFFEDSDDYPSCYNPVTYCTEKNPTYGLAFATDAFERVGLADRWAYYDAHTESWLGPAAGHIPAVCRDADLLLNVGALNPLRPWYQHIPGRVLIDGEAVFTQIRHLTRTEARKEAEQYTAFFSFAENVGKAGCTIPSDGFQWQATRQPIVLNAWPVTPGRPRGQFTCVLNWDSIPAPEYNGVRYGMKSVSFEEYLELPQKTGAIFTLAVGSPTAPRDLLRSKGWTILEPSELGTITKDPWVYQRFLQDSKAEFCINRHGFVTTWSGWFSERSAAYMASGRPVLAQDTGFSSYLQTGKGLLAFSTMDEATEGIKAINSQYGLHCRAARALAEEYFDSRKVLSSLIEASLNLR